MGLQATVVFVFRADGESLWPLGIGFRVCIRFT